jgi:hypothetical protein
MGKVQTLSNSECLLTMLISFRERRVPDDKNLFNAFQRFTLWPCDCNLCVITQCVCAVLAFHISKKIVRHLNFLYDTLNHIGTCLTSSSTRTGLVIRPGLCVAHDKKDGTVVPVVL